MKRQGSGGRAGFTMVELLVLLAVILLLLAAVLPALFRVQQSAGNISAQNSLRMLGLGCHNAHDAYNKFPPLIGVFPGNDSPTSTLHFQLLPFMEQDNVYRRFVKDPMGALDVPIPMYADARDPSAPPEGRFQGWVATTNYAGNWLVFGDKGGTIAQLTDGTSNTLMFAQRYQVCNGQPMGWAYARLYHWAPMFAYYSKARFQAQPKQEDCDPALPQSLSPGGIIVLMCDGSSRTVSPNVSPRVWWLVTDPRDGQVIPADF